MICSQKTKSVSSPPPPITRLLMVLVDFSDSSRDRTITAPDSNVGKMVCLLSQSLPPAGIKPVLVLRLLHTKRHPEQCFPCSWCTLYRCPYVCYHKQTSWWSLTEITCCGSVCKEIILIVTADREERGTVVQRQNARLSRERPGFEPS